MTQNTAIIRSLDSSLESLKILRKDLLFLNAKDRELNWAIGGLVATLTQALLKICDKVFAEVHNDESNAKADILKIQTEFSNFIDRMLIND